MQENITVTQEKAKNEKQTARGVFTLWLDAGTCGTEQ